MVANITSGADFADMVAYALGRDEPDKKAKILCASDGILLTDTEDYRTVARLFEAYSLRGDHQLRDPLKHISLSWHARDGTRLTDELMLKVMREYMKLMGIEDTEYFATRHHDKKHPHLHFMFSRVNRKGEVIDASNERERSRKACLYLTKKYGFYISSGKESVNRDRLRGKDKAKYAIYDKVVKCKDKAKNWEEFNDKLKAEGIAMKFRYNNATGKVMGISFSDGKLSFSGSQLDRSLTLPKLTEKFGDINSLGKKKNSNMMYNDGSLLVCDDKNFGARKSRKELVCLKIEVNEYMNLTARTTSFSNPFNEKELLKHRTCAFQIAKDFDGDYWSGQAVKPIIIKSVKGGEYDLKKLFIQKKNFKDNKNLVPYWPYNVDDYSHGKLYVIWQVVESVNEAFKGTVEVNFRDSQVIHYDECKTKDGILALVQEYLAGRSISFEDPFQTNGSKSLISNFKNEAQEIMSGHLVFPKKPTPDDVLIKLCEPKEEEYEVTQYSQSMTRMLNNGNALQHITYYGDEKLDLLDTSSVRRILIELIVKDSLAKRVMPKPLAEVLVGWNAIRYKINQGNVHGASMKIDNHGTIEIEQYGLSQDNQGEDFENFISQKLKYSDFDKIRGARDYMALVKNGNVYFIIDTDEIPILDVNLIDEAYSQVANEGETVAMFKRKKVAHDYLRGYIGFHLWETEGIDGEPNSSYSYISGTNSESMKITPKTKMDKMPRARRIFILHKERPELIDEHIFEICEMLKFGFGRWNEMMTYPFPFKFLQEYLDDAAETAFSIHWKDITYKKDL